MASSKIVGLEVEPGHRQFVDVAAQGAVVQHLARDVVEPEALSQIVKGLCRFHMSTCKSEALREIRSPIRSITRSGGGNGSAAAPASA